MEERLLQLQGHEIPSSSGRRVYTVAQIEVGVRVTLTGQNRQDSVLRWADIERVYDEAGAEPLTPTRVDAILGEHPATHNASTMCALVLALRDPIRASS